jgi:hypothetical protein
MIKKIIASISALIILHTGISVSAELHRERGHIITGGTTIIEAEWFDEYDDGGIEPEPGADSGARTVPRQEPTDNTARNDAPYPNFNIGYINPGDYLQFTVYVEMDGHYRFDAWVASGAAMPGSVEFIIPSMNGKHIGFAEPSQRNSAGWHTWYLETAGSVNITAGTHIIRTNFPFGAVNFDAFAITRLGDMIIENNAPAADDAPQNEPTAAIPDSVQSIQSIQNILNTPSEANNLNETETVSPQPADGNGNMVLWAMVAAVALAMIAALIIFALRRMKTQM